jgi:hypothetical protein
MKPQTRETAILMLVDSIEAASRTIDPPERDEFEAMVQRVVFTKLKQGQLDESGLNLSELKIIVNRMADTLANMHHHRIKYQWQAKRAEEFGVPSQAVRERSQSGIVPAREIHGPIAGLDQLRSAAERAEHRECRGREQFMPDLTPGAIHREPAGFRPDWLDGFTTPGPVHQLADRVAKVEQAERGVQPETHGLPGVFRNLGQLARGDGGRVPGIEHLHQCVFEACHVGM